MEMTPIESAPTNPDGWVEIAAGPETERLAGKVALEAAGHSSLLLYNWNLLGQILDRHEDSLRKRWIKKTKTWRKTILSKAWYSDMPLCHRPDIDHLAREKKKLSEEGILGKRPVNTFIWPYINMEDLIRDKPILCLLNTRARYSPSTFVDHELEFCRLGLDTDTVIPPLKLNGYTMHLDGETVESYGKLVTWGDNSSPRAGFKPGDGMLILEIQEQVMVFLVKWCEAVLNKPADVLVNQFPVEPRMGPVVIVSHWPTIEILATYAPYVIPVETNFYRLKDFINARHSAAQDHIQTLREDPGYFQDTVLQYSEHRAELILDSMGNIHWIYDNPQFWDRTLSTIVDNAYRDVAVWDVLAKQVRLVMSLQKKYAREIDPRYALPPEYRKHVQLLRGLLLHSSKNPHTNMKNMLPASPRVRNLWERENLNRKMMARIRCDIDEERDPLLWVYLKLQNDDEYHRYGHKDLVDEMEKLVFAQPEQNERISLLIAGQFSDLGLSVLMQHEIENYHPWAAEFKSDQSSDIWITGQLPKLYSHVLEFGRHRLSLLLTKDNAITMWRAEKNLDLFWEEVDKQYEAMTGKALSETFAHHFPVKHELERTPEWIEPYKEDFIEMDGRKEAKVKAKDLTKTISSLKRQNKNSPTKYAASQAVLLDTMKGVFKLDPRAYRVFKALFHTPSDEDGPEAISWGDFLYFMSAMEFSPLKLYGNLWHFSNRFIRPTQFYAPQPDSRIFLRAAIRMGRRLRRTYDWHPEMFVLDNGKGKGKSS